MESVFLGKRNIKKSELDWGIQKEHDKMLIVEILHHTVVLLAAGDIVALHQSVCSTLNSLKKRHKSGHKILMCYTTRTTNTLIISYPIFTPVFLSFCDVCYRACNSGQIILIRCL